MNRTVLVIGPDLEFVFWVGRALDQAGYDAFPARSVEAAAEIISELHLSPNLVILTAHLPDAAELLADLRQTHENLRVLKLAGPENGNHIAVDKVYPRPTARTEEARSDLLKTICGVLDGSPVPR